MKTHIFVFLAVSVQGILKNKKSLFLREYHDVSKLSILQTSMMQKYTMIYD